MNRIIAIFTFIGILLQTFNQVVIVADYYANKEYITNNLCENKNKPQLHCEGKCCLKKKLDKQEKQQAPAPNNQKNHLVINLFCASNKFELSHYLFSSYKLTYYTRNELNTNDFQHSVFHPPSV